MINLFIGITASMFTFFAAFYTIYVIDGFKNGIFNLDKLNILQAHFFILGIATLITFGFGDVNAVYKIILAIITFAVPSITELFVKKLFKPLKSL